MTDWTEELARLAREAQALDSSQVTLGAAARVYAQYYAALTPARVLALLDGLRARRPAGGLNRTVSFRHRSSPPPNLCQGLAARNRNPARTQPCIFCSELPSGGELAAAQEGGRQPPCRGQAPGNGSSG